MKKHYTEPAIEWLRLALQEVILSSNVSPTEAYETPIKRIRKAMEEELENNGEMVEDPVDE